MKKAHLCLSPIVLFTYNRLSCLQQTIEAMQENVLASKSKLCIFSDGPKGDDDGKDVDDVRKYQKTINGFADIQIIERRENWGLAKNVVDGVTSIVNEYGKVIVLEDDLVTGQHFLQFMNDGLNMYENNLNVICIHGYGYINNNSIPETYFLNTAGNLGRATWKRGWDLFEQDGQKLLNEIKSRGISYKFDRNGTYPYTKMLKNDVHCKIKAPDIRWSASALLNNKYTLYPKHSLVSHIGAGDQATNYKSRQKDPLSVELYQEKIEVEKTKVEEKDYIGDLYNRFLKQYKSPIFKRLINKLKTIASKMART